MCAQASNPLQSKTSSSHTPRSPHHTSRHPARHPVRQPHHDGNSSLPPHLLPDGGMRLSSDSDGNASDSSEYSHEMEVEVEDPNIIRIGIIADSEVTLGFLLAGIGYHRERFRNYLMVENDMPIEEIEHFFQILYNRPNIGIILLDYLTARRLHAVLEKCNEVLPVVIIIPTKASILPYLEEKERLRRQRQREAYL